MINTKKQFFIKLKQDNKPERNKRIGYFFLAPLLLLLALEVMHLTYPNTIIRFFSSVYFPVKLLITYIFLLSVQCMFYTFTQSAFFSHLITTLLMFGLGYATEVLGRINGNPLLPTDFLLIGNIKEIASFAKIPVFLSAFLALAISIFSLVKHWKICRKYEKRLTTKYRVGLGLVSFAVFSVVIYSFCFSTSFKTRILPKIDVSFSPFNPIDDYNSNGVVLTFFPRISELSVERPENYSEFAIKALKHKYDAPKSIATEKKPNIILIQNEAWWDPSVLPEVDYDGTDLLSGIHSLRKNTLTGRFLTPVYAGGTCKPEFEVLTSISTYLLPSSVYPYTQYITKSTPSMVSAYKNSGYQTIALHPYRKNFYNRSTAYPLMGFETFKGIEEFDFKDISGAYIDDMSCVKQIIKEFENKTKDRIFEFVITMENHGTYTYPRYNKFDFEMTASTLSKEDYFDLKRFSQGVYNADKAFMALVDYFENINEPVMLVMYGDHLPLLGTNASTLINTGYVEETEKFVSSKFPYLYETPFVIWTNYEIPDFDMPELISGNTLGYKILAASGCDIPWYYNIINAFTEKYPATTDKYVYNNSLELIEDVEPEDMHIVSDYRLLMYDILNGKRYAVKNEQNQGN